MRSVRWDWTRSDEQGTRRDHRGRLVVDVQPHAAAGRARRRAACWRVSSRQAVAREDPAAIRDSLRDGGLPRAPREGSGRGDRQYAAPTAPRARVGGPPARTPRPLREADDAEPGGGVGARAPRRSETADAARSVRLELQAVQPGSEAADRWRRGRRSRVRPLPHGFADEGIL